MLPTPLQRALARFRGEGARAVSVVAVDQEEPKVW